MKHFLRSVITGLFIVSSAFAAGTVQQSISQLGKTDNWVLAFNWTGDAVNGTVPVTAGQGLVCCQGYLIVQVETVPLTPAPTGGYAVAITDPAGVDALGGAAASLSSSAAQSFAASTSAPPVQGTLSLVITGQSVAGARGVVYVFLSKPGTVNLASLGRGGGSNSANWLTIANPPFFDWRKYNWTTQFPSGNILAGQVNTIKLSPCPAGFAGSTSGGLAATALYIAGTGTPEAVLPTASVVSGSGCSVTLSATNVLGSSIGAHGAGFTVGPTSFGLQEAVNAAATAGGGMIYIGPGSYTLYAGVTVASSNIWIEGSGIGDFTNGGTRITRTGDFGDSIYVLGPVQNVRVEGLEMIHTVNFSAGPPTSISNKPSSGAHVHLYICWECRVKNNSLWNLPYGVDADSVGRTIIEDNEFGSPWDNLNSAVQVGIAAVYLHHSVSGYGFPTYTYVQRNEIVNSGYGSAPRTITVNGNAITNHVDPLGSLYGVWISSCEVCFVVDNTIEWNNSTGIHVAAIAAHAVSDAMLDTKIDGNYLDYHRLNGIDFDMSANTSMFALNFRALNNRIGGSNGTITGVLFAPPAVTGTYVRTSASSLIEGNHIANTLGSGIAMFSGGRTLVTGNDISGYNNLNSYPTNSLTCSPHCTGDRLGNSGVYAGEAAVQYTVVNNRLGGGYAGGSYDGSSVFTVNGVSVGYDSSFVLPAGTTAPNANGGVQAPGSRSPAVKYDPAFIPVLPTVTDGDLTTVTSTGCGGAVGATATATSGTFTSTTTGTCTTALVFNPSSAPAGWNCSFQNLTHPGGTNAIYQTATAVNSVTVSGTTVSGDVISYSCSPY